MRLGLTYLDVLLVPKRTPLSSRTEADVRTRFTKNIFLNIPLASSNMATVTEHKMAIALAREGGLGVIHQFGAVEEQAAEVKKVKKSTSYIIEDPLCVRPDITIGQAVETMIDENVTSLLVTKIRLPGAIPTLKGEALRSSLTTADFRNTNCGLKPEALDPLIPVKEGEELVGIFTHRDYLFEEDLSKKISEVMTPKERLITARPGITLDEAKQILKRHRIEKLPLLDNGRICGLITTQDLKKIGTWPNAARDKKGRLLVGAAVGVKDTLERSRALIEAGADVIVLDLAHGHSDLVVDKIREFKKHFPGVELMAGNIATKEAARDLILAGVDGLKVGIGPSPVCITRIISGSGIPQLTAVLDVAEIAKQHNIPVSADGGIRYPGDLSKALAAGASTAYCGNIFAGTDETPGIIITMDGKRYKRYMGSASYDSNHERKENTDGRKFTQKLDVFVEGVANLVDYKGPVREVIRGMINGLRSGMSYCGARDIQEMQKNAEFIQVTPAGWEEGLNRGKKLSE